MRAAAGIILIRGSRVFLAVRSGSARFLPGFHSFPGGAVEAVDREVAVEEAPVEPELVSAALRELFEETGVLLAHGPVPPERLREAARLELCAGRLSWREFLDRHGLVLSGRSLLPAGVRVTPPYSAIRFRAQFFLAECPPDQEPRVFDAEISGGLWLEPGEALRQWSRGEILLPAPTLGAMRHLAARSPADAARAMEEEGPGNGLPGPEIPLAPGLIYLPLETATIPPARHTNAIFLGGERMLLIDPGSDRPDQLELLRGVMAALETEGRRILEVVLTHHHPDHAAGACALGLPIAAHPLTARKVRVDRTLDDGFSWDLGRDPFGGAWDIAALHTPGHAPGHLALWEPQRRFLVAGDLVSGVSTIVIEPTEGDMALYLESLAQMRALRPRLVLPAHGPPSGPESDVFGQLIQHRLERERRVAGALSARPAAPEDLLPLAYPDLPRDLYPVAERSLLAHLIKLAREGRAIETGSGWKTTP
ncbi:MAG: MBL fold metallo-hydrolase [Armatimonadetes bacterium]|nr:MBL fold metallo-hydrolase [Armatimonadota bacterium]